MNEINFNHSMKMMINHIMDADFPVYQASVFWKRLADHNMQQLDMLGLENFKRTVNQNYFTFIPTSVTDSTFMAMARYWGSNPSLDALKVKL